MKVFHSPSVGWFIDNDWEDNRSAGGEGESNGRSRTWSVGIVGGESRAFRTCRLAPRTRPGIRRGGAQASAGATSSFRSRHRPSATPTFPPRRSSRITRHAASCLLVPSIHHLLFSADQRTDCPPQTLPRDFEFSRPRSMFPPRPPLLHQSIHLIGSRRWLTKGRRAVCTTR